MIRKARWQGVLRWEQPHSRDLYHYTPSPYMRYRSTPQSLKPRTTEPEHASKRPTVHTTENKAYHHLEISVTTPGMITLTLS